jgi:hypothetical protein
MGLLLLPILMRGRLLYFLSQAPLQRPPDAFRFTSATPTPLDRLGFGQASHPHHVRAAATMAKPTSSLEAPDGNIAPNAPPRATSGYQDHFWRGGWILFFRRSDL